ncbi:hypothetical protein [Maricaulis sp.]|uniref:hypothetical protein n=1 Tax=Maricaulis sp. TaxID=1486257 RepID=UPI00260F0734|nr:hypothetical protein [Maricaulis sp.]
MSRKLIRDEDPGEYFVGYLDAPKVDRRYLLGLSVLGLGIAGGAGALLAKKQGGAGQGSWDMATQVTLSGYLSETPYPLLRTTGLDGSMQTVLLACDTKCGAQEKLAAASVAGDRVNVRGSLIQRGRHVMMAVANEDDWISADQTLPARLTGFDEEDLGMVELNGEILDSKCWFGAMRPNEGAGHKACAMLCIAGGLAPYFYARDRLGRSRAMMITDPEGHALVQPILRYVADPVRVTGRVHRIEDLLQLRLDPADLTRV